MASPDLVRQPAFWIACYGAGVSTLGIAWQIHTWKGSGARIRVRRVKVEKYVDPHEWTLVVEVVNSGRMTGRVEKIGIAQRLQPSTPVDLYLELEPEGETPSHDLLPGHRLTAKTNMQHLMETWHPKGTLSLVGKVVLGSGKTKTSWSAKSVKVPHPKSAKTLPTRGSSPGGETGVSPAPGLEIVEAKYGANGIYTDIRDQLEERRVGNSLDVVLTNEVAGTDPVYGVGKHLLLVYRLNGHDATKRFEEGGRVLLP